MSNGVQAVSDAVKKHGLGEAIIDHFGREIADVGAVPTELRDAWREAYDALATVSELIEEFTPNQGDQNDAPR